MRRFITLGSFFLVILHFVSCQSTGADEATPDLREILPNSTWYTLIPDSNNVYMKSKYGDFNTIILNSLHNFPCGSAPNNTLTGEYTIFDKNKLRLEFIYLYPSTSENEVISKSEGEIVMRNLSNDFQTTFISNCNDLK